MTSERSSGLTRVAIAIWAVIGAIIIATIVLLVLASVSELVLPLVFAVMIGATAYPLARSLEARGFPSALAALTVVSSVVLGICATVLLTVKALVQETGALSRQIDIALARLEADSDGLGLDAATLDRIRAAIASIAGFIGRGLLTLLAGGVSATVGFVAGTVLALLLMYYVVKDGPVLKAWVVGQAPEAAHAEMSSFVSDAVYTIRAYWAGRSVLSAAITAVIVVVSLIMNLPLIGTIALVNFIGGFVPYIGAFIGGGLASLLALAHGGISQGLLMLFIVLVCNLLLENLLEPKIMSGRLRIHPLVVLIATTAGGVIGGIVGLVLAVPLTVVAVDGIKRLRHLGVLRAARQRAEPVLRKAIAGEPVVTDD